MLEELSIRIKPNRDPNSQEFVLSVSTQKSTTQITAAGRPLLYPQDVARMICSFQRSTH